MARKLAGRRLIALTFNAIGKSGRHMVASAPWSLCVFFLSLPFALLAFKSVGAIQFLFLLLALINLLALARMTFAWTDVVASRDAVVEQPKRAANAEAKHLALLVLFVVVAGAVLRASADIPLWLYFALNSGGDAKFFVALFCVLGLIWVPTISAGAVYVPSLPRAASSGEYGFKVVRQTMVFRRWPLAMVLFSLVVSAGVTKTLVADIARRATLSGIAYGLAGMLICTAMLVIATMMAAIACRESSRGSAETVSDAAMVA